MRTLGLLALLGSLTACGERLSAVQFSEGTSVADTGDPGDNSVRAEVNRLPWKHVEWEYKFNNRQITRMTLAGDQLFLETPDHQVIAMDRFTGRTSWMFKIDTETPLDWAPVVAQGVPEEIRMHEGDLQLINRQIDDKLKEFGPGKETQALQKKRAEIRERLRVAAFGDNAYFISKHVLYCLDRLNGGLRWTHRLGFVPSARPFAVRNYVFIPGVERSRVWALDVDRKGAEVTFYKASIVERENQILNSPVYSDPSLYFACHDGNVYCYKVNDGSLTWTYKTERALRADPVVYFYRSMEAAPGVAPAAKPADGAAPAMGAPAMGAPAMGAPQDKPAMGAPAMGAPQDKPAMGAAPAGADGKKRVVSQTRILFQGSDDNAFYALDADGGNLIWKYECGARIKSPAVAKDSTVYVKTEDGALNAFEVMPVHRDPKTGASIGPKRNGNLRWKLPMGERFIFKGKHYIYVMGPNEEIWAVEEATGKAVGKYKTELLQFIPTNTVDDYIYVANGGGYVYCLKESRQAY